MKQPEHVQLSAGCFHLKSFLNATGQQGFIDSIREMIMENPQKMRFQRSEKLAKDFAEETSSVFGTDQYIADKKRELAERNAKKFGCYVLDVSHRDMSLHEIKMLGLTIEEGVNLAVKAAQAEGKEFGASSANAGHQQNLKAQYQRYIFDFYKEPEEDGEHGDSGGYSEKIDLPNIGKSGHAKKNKHTLNYFAVSFGSTIELEYEIEEEGDSPQKLSVTLNSGDAFVTNSLVKSISYRVLRTTNIHDQQLVMREGCLVLQAERD